jgi:hypothetical protein
MNRSYAIRQDNAGSAKMIHCANAVKVSSSEFKKPKAGETLDELDGRQGQDHQNR